MADSNESSIWKKIGKGALITGGVITGVALAPIALGFGSTGIVGGSIAATIQSAIGNVAAGSLFATCTSLGMTGAFTSTATVGGTIMGVGGLASYFSKNKKNYDPKDDVQFFVNTLGNKDNPDLPDSIIKLLEARMPYQIDLIRKKYNELGENRDFDTDILNCIPENLRNHAKNLLTKDNDILGQTDEVKELLNNLSFEKYVKKDFNSEDDLKLIDSVIRNEDNFLIIIRLFQYRDGEQKLKINSDFSNTDIIRDNDIRNKGMYDYVYNYVPDYEKAFLEKLLSEIKK